MSWLSSFVNELMANPYMAGTGAPPVPPVTFTPPFAGGPSTGSTGPTGSGLPPNTTTTASPTTGGFWDQVWRTTTNPAIAAWDWLWGTSDPGQAPADPGAPNPPKGYANWGDWLKDHPNATVGDMRKAAGLDPGGTTPGKAVKDYAQVEDPPNTTLFGIERTLIAKYAVDGVLFVVLAIGLLNIARPGAGTAVASSVPGVGHVVRAVRGKKK